MSSTVDLSESDHPVCRDRLIQALDELSNDDVLTVYSDHDPEPVLVQYRGEQSPSFQWTYKGQGPDEWVLAVQKNEEQTLDETTFDAREWPPSKRHEMILRRFQNLDVGASFELINDHDPRPLYHELRSLHRETFDWEYRKQESGEFRIEITKTAKSQPLPEEASTRVDVRVIPPPERHKTIFHRFDMLASGDAMEIVADHDPQPLRHQLQETHGENGFEWEYRQKTVDEVRVLLRKVDSESPSSEDPTARKETSRDMKAVEELDVRPFDPQERHHRVFERYESLDPGEAFLLINDHDPKPLYYQMKEEMPGEVRWEYRDEGGQAWKVLIGKEAVSDG